MLSDDKADSQRHLHSLFESARSLRDLAVLSVFPQYCFYFKQTSHSDSIQQRKINKLRIGMAFYFTHPIKCTLFFRSQEKDIQVSDLAAFIILSLTYCTNTLTHGCAFLTFILILLPNVPFCKSCSHFIVCSIWDSRVIPKGKNEVGTRSPQQSYWLCSIKKYPLHFNGCHIPQLAASTFMWSILCILFSLAHQVHLKAQTPLPRFIRCTCHFRFLLLLAGLLWELRLSVK